MKMLTHRDPVSENPPFDLELTRQVLRLEDDETEQDSVIENIAWTAASEIEQIGQLALLTQSIRVTIFDPKLDVGLRLPIGPADDGNTPTVTIDGEAYTDFEFLGGNRPYIQWKHGLFDLRPSRISIEYLAGFGDDVTAIPRDLQQAIMDQAALLFLVRGEPDKRLHSMSPHLMRIAAKYRGVQV